MTGTSPPFPEEGVLASALEVVGADGQVKTEFLVLPFGNPFYGRDGRGPWILRDKGQAEQVIATSRQFLGSCDMMLDYDHQSYYAGEGVGNQAPASGWVRDLRVEDDGIHVTVKWTPEAEAELASRRFRYVSPYFRVNPASREVTRLVNIALTNSPNLDLPALAHQQSRASTGEDPDMNKISIVAAALATALAIPAEGMDEAKVLAAIGKLKAEKDGAETALASIRTELQLGDDAGSETVLAAVQSAKKAGEPDPAKFVPKAGYDELAGRLKALEEDKVLAAVDQGVTDGKIAPAMKEWAVDLGKKDFAALNSFLESAPAFGGDKPKVEGDPQPEKGKLSDEEKAICSQLGVSEADYLKTRDEEAA